MPTLFRFIIASLAAALTVQAAAVSLVKRDVSSAQCLAEYCGPYETIEKRVDATPTIAQRLSNAERLSRGLPLKKPDLRRETPVQGSVPSASPSQTIRGTIQVSRADGAGELGFISKNLFSRAQYRYQDVSQALVVSFSLPATITTNTFSQLELIGENSEITSLFPIIGLVQGRDNTNTDLSSDSYQYLYVSGTNSNSVGTPSNVGNAYSTATGTSRSSESFVWNIDLSTNELTLTWVNSDNSKSHIEFFTQSTALYAGGSSAKFLDKYPSPVIDVKYTFVPL